MKIVLAKDTFNALTETDPSKLIFSTDYGTLKYFTKVNQLVQIDGPSGDWAGLGTIDHNLGYYPYVEVFVRVYIGSPSGNYEYCPFEGAGATVLYSANYRITTTQIKLYGEHSGVPGSIWNFDFMVFIFKNNLSL